MMRNFKRELAKAADTSDWDAHSRIWEERRVAEVECDEIKLAGSSFYAYAKAYNSETGKWDRPIITEHRTKQDAINWCAFNRDWMVDLWVDG